MGASSKQETSGSSVPTKSDQSLWLRSRNEGESPVTIGPSSKTLAARSAGGPSSSSRWLSIRQIALDLGVSTSTAYKWSSRGRPWFPRSIRLHNGDIRVRRDWYEEWLDEQENQ